MALAIFHDQKTETATVDSEKANHTLSTGSPLSIYRFTVNRWRKKNHINMPQKKANSHIIF